MRKNGETQITSKSDKVAYHFCCTTRTGVHVLHSYFIQFNDDLIFHSAALQKLEFYATVRCRLRHYTKAPWRDIKTKDTLEPKMGCRPS